MNPNSEDIPTTDEAYASPSLIEGLRQFPSESAQPCPKIDAAILGLGSQKMAEIRNKKVIRWNWSLGAIAACLLLGGLSFLFLPSKLKPAPSIETASEDEVIIYREVGALFADSLNSVIINESGLKIVLSESHEMENRQPVVLEVCESSQCQKIITFVGQTVEIGGYRIMVNGQTKGQVTIKNGTLSNPAKPLPQITIKALPA